MKKIQKIELIIKHFGFIAGFFILIKKFYRTILIRYSTFYWSKKVFKCGRNSIFNTNIKIDYPKNIIVGENCYIGSDTKIGSERIDAKLRIHDNVKINNSVQIDYSGDLEIGDGSLISEGVIIYTHSHNYDPRSTPIFRKLKIGKNVWIGARSIIMPNVEIIGDDSIVGANSLVLKSIGPKQIVGGNPAKFIKKRPDLE
ncbi:MAG: hypothetical protein KatS3mg096_880 [Candidatus Parcubacteria bacterium]|nr:MAG: hypothetical protein KatS3mg096_880 [Candidatus Parcubacteria bacterium]